MSYMMDCASGQTATRREQIAREAKETLLGDSFNWPFPDVCEEWNAPDLGDGHFEDVGGHVHGGPDNLEQFFLGDQPAGPFGET